LREVVVVVNQFVCMNYTKGKIGFRFDGGVIPFEIGFVDNSAYHIDSDDLNYLQQLYPQNFPSFNRRLHLSKKNWGENVIERNLCKLMMHNKLVLRRTYKEEETNIRFKWVGPVWNRASYHEGQLSEQGQHLLRYM